MSFSEDTE